jgi:NAD(P)H-dependent FMN reductase
MPVLVFAASPRSTSLNEPLARIAAERLTASGKGVDHAVQDSAGFPPGVVRFNPRLKAADGFVISTPEYNFSMAGTLKSLIDWSSRERPSVFKGGPASCRAQAGLVLGADGRLTDDKLSRRLDTLLAAFVKFAAALGRE